MGKGKEMNIVYAMTRNVYHKILPSLRSMADTNPDAKIYILAEDDELPFETPMPVTVINVSDQKYFPEIAANREKAFGGYINHLKICYASILPKLQKVIHIDIDTIICDSLEGFWKTDVKGKWFAAVPERQTWYKPFGDTYYNMGVALFNLQQIRKDKIQQDMIDYLMTTEQPFADQNAWNKFGIEQGKAATLDLRYNESRPTGYTENPAIVHYCSFPNWWEDVNEYRREYLDRYM